MVYLQYQEKYIAKLNLFPSLFSPLFFFFHLFLKLLNFILFQLFLHFDFNSLFSTEMRVFFTVAVDLILVNVSEPIRFIVESKAKIYPQHEKFWSLSDTTPHHELFTLQFNRVRNTAAHIGLIIL